VTRSISRRQMLAGTSVFAIATLSPANALILRGGGADVSAVTGRSQQNLLDVSEYPFLNFFKTWDGPSLSIPDLPTIIDANGFPSGTPTNNIGGVMYFPSYANWVVLFKGTTSIAFAPVGGLTAGPPTGGASVAGA
jgi:hypothetical protein